MLARRCYVGEARDAEGLATRLTQSTWTLCPGFGLGSYLILNDSTE
jgi:hypothetical protein